MSFRPVIAGMVNVSGGAGSVAAITSGTITGITDLAVADGGTGASTGDGALTNLGLTTAGAAIAKIANPSAVRYLRINADNTVTALSQASLVNDLAGAASLGLPVILSVKDVSVLTAGAPADLATINLPSGVTRWCMPGGTGSSHSRAIAETAAGTLAGATIGVYDQPAGAGNLMVSATPALPASAGISIGIIGSSSVTSTSAALTIRQNANSANAGTVSFYIFVIPLP